MVKIDFVSHYGLLILLIERNLLGILIFNFTYHFISDRNIAFANANTVFLIILH